VSKESRSASRLLLNAVILFLICNGLIATNCRQETGFKEQCGFFSAFLALPFLPAGPAIAAEQCQDVGSDMPPDYRETDCWLPQITGPDQPQTAGAYSYVATCGCGPPYKWTVVPQNPQSVVSIDQNGRLSLTGNSCGAFTITVEDSCGHKGVFSGRVGYNGHWTLVDSFSCSQDDWAMCTYYDEIIEGDKKYARVAKLWVTAGDTPQNSGHRLCTVEETGCSAIHEGPYLCWSWCVKAWKVVERGLVYEYQCN